MPRPKNVSAVKRFLGMVGYFREYVWDMSNRTKHLHAPLHKGIPFKWTSAHDAEFTDLKQAVLSPDTMLYHPYWNSTFELHTDASKHGVGAKCMMVSSVLLSLHHICLPPQSQDGRPHIKNYSPLSGVFNTFIHMY